eukprot:10608132-Ditylum_brightwellii.AAC.1
MKSSTKVIDDATIQNIQGNINEVNNATIQVANSLNDHLEKLEKSNIRKLQDTDVFKWFILKQDFKTHPGETLKNNLKDIKLASNKLTGIEAFYDSINLTVGTAIGRSYAFKMHDEMSGNDYDIVAILLPQITHKKCNEAVGQFNNLLNQDRTKCHVTN